MIIFIDENLPATLARALDLLETATEVPAKVHSIKDYFHKGIPDEEWIPQIGKMGGTIITQDHNIHRKQYATRAL
jgi:hypothetical protein